MEILNIEGTDDTPRVVLDKEHNIFEISGRSLPEDSVDFYKPILKWITDYKQDSNTTTEFVFKLEYSNTSSSKLIQDILTALKEINGIKVIWCYRQDDEDMEEAGGEIFGQRKILFEFKF